MKNAPLLELPLASLLNSMTSLNPEISIGVLLIRVRFRRVEKFRKKGCTPPAHPFSENPDDC